MNHCPKCEGTGHLAEYAGIRKGICFTCGGTGKKITAQKKNESKFKVGDKIKKNGYKTIFTILEITKKHYLTECETIYGKQENKLGRYIDNYPEDSKEGYIKLD